MTDATAPQPVYRRDYTPPAYTVDTIELRFELGETHTDVQSIVRFRRHPSAPEDAPLRLDGQRLTLNGLWLDGQALDSTHYRVDADHLTIPNVPQQFELRVHTRIVPQENKALEGLYQSSGNFCTQCEAEGFRRITYYPDRPDVMAIFTTTLVAERARYPVLLSNGDRIDSGELDDGRHWVTWHDPHPKPSYLFALVAGQLSKIEGRFETRSQRQVKLEIYVEPHNIDQCAHAMQSLIHAMRWDENVFGLEYDLDTYMIVAVGDFNMGAMENKGLNVFNTKYVLAKPTTATDRDFTGIESVIAHEYFHNWTGNRVTCRDWFQLSLKEGLTVFRDQEFSADQGSRGVQRIDAVRVLRAAQFPEDAGPMAHPVRPDSYIEINNFYTPTVYNKGAEVVRMIHTLCSAEGFRRGMDLYFERHDGQAVTCDDFVAAMEDANGIELEQFRLWYSQSGTPRLHVERHYDPSSSTYTLTLTQHTAPTPEQPQKAPLHIPVRVGLIGHDGQALALTLDGENTSGEQTSRVLELRESRQSFRFVGIDAPPVPSILRGFSAPLTLDIDYTDEELSFLLAHDDDEFNRWEASQTLGCRHILRGVNAGTGAESDGSSTALVDAFRTVLDSSIDPALRSQILTLPSEAFLLEQMQEADPDRVFEARERLRSLLADRLYDQWLETYRRYHERGAFETDSSAVGRRALKNLCLDYLLRTRRPEALAHCLDQLHNANNMTDELGALAPLTHCDTPERERELDAFYERWSHEALVVDKWFSLQAMSSLPDTFERVKALLDHPAYSRDNPNKIRALLGAFCKSNPVRFHDLDGQAYAFLADRILEIDRFNPQVAANLSGALSRWRKYTPERQRAMRTQLERLQRTPTLSPDVFELVKKSLAG